MQGPTASSPQKIAEPNESQLADATPFGMGRMLFAGSPDTVVERLRIFQSLTGVGVVSRVYTDLATIDITPEGLAARAVVGSLPLLVKVGP